MKMTLEQTKLVGLTMELDLKVREYNELCKKLDKVKAQGIDPNDESLLDLKQEFLDNQKAIETINKQLEELNNKNN